MQRRQHPRVQLRLPARLRWSAPLGQRTESCETINASHGGLLVACREAHRVGRPLWVTFPFDADASGMQPELPAHVARTEEIRETTERGSKRWKVALRFERAADRVSSGNGIAGENERKKGAGTNIALPIRVRPRHLPWHEDAMAVQVCGDHLKFLTNREYALGERLRVGFVAGSGAPRAGDEEWEAEVTGIEMEAEGASVLVTVQRKPG